MASKAVAQMFSRYLKSRKGKMPIRVATLLKKASEPGQDLRMPLMGGTKFPTKDSKTKPNQLLNQSKAFAEVGPAPSYNQLNPTGPSPSQLAGVSQGVMPKIGADMSLAKDPLIVFLKRAMQVETNDEAMPAQKIEPPLTSECPRAFLSTSLKKSKSDWSSYLSTLFKDTSGARQKTVEERPIGDVPEPSSCLLKSEDDR